MKKLLMVLALLALTASSAFAQFDNNIGIYADLEAMVCDAGSDAYTTTTIYMYAILSMVDFSTVSAVEFKVSGAPSAAEAITTFNWNTDLAIGDWNIDLSLAYNPVLDGPMAYLGAVDFFWLTGVPADRVVTVVPADGFADIIIVDGVDFVEHAGGGFYFTFNCTQNCDCVTPTQDAAWGAIKALY